MSEEVSAAKTHESTVSTTDNVRVLREGPEPPPSWVHTTDCSKCGSLLEYSTRDIQEDNFKVSGYFFAGTEKLKRKTFITCPHCGEAVFVRSW